MLGFGDEQSNNAIPVDLRVYTEDMLVSLLVGAVREPRFEADILVYST